MTDVISAPVRCDIEELFPTCASYVLDERGRRELRTCAEFRRATLAVLEAVHDLMSPTPNPDHLNTITTDFLATLASEGRRATDMSTMPAYLSNRLGAMSDDSFQYYLRSVTFMRLQAAGGHSTVGANGIQMFEPAANVKANYAPVLYIPELIINLAVVRKHPFIRFNPSAYVVFMHHWDEIDAEGVPRISIDGYANV